jgi:hypothetical protein
MAPRTIDQTEVKPARAAADKKTAKAPAKPKPATPAKKASPPAKKR